MLIDRLRKELHRPLPGPEAQYRMAHVARRNPAAPPDHARRAAVMALFYPQGKNWSIVLIERVSHNSNDQHRGQISFPGGKVDVTDPSLRYTALRETEEEIGVPKELVEVIGQMTPLYIPVSNFLVTPFVGFMEEKPSFTPEVSEVNDILEVPADDLFNPDRIGTTSITISEHMVLQRVPYYDFGGKVVWGATAMMLSELNAIAQPALIPE